MVKLFVKRLIFLSAVTMPLYACLPNKGAGRFAKGIIEVVKLLLVIMPILELMK